MTPRFWISSEGFCFLPNKYASIKSQAQIIPDLTTDLNSAAISGAITTYAYIYWLQPL